MLRRTIAATALASALLLPMAGVALGHECFIASRSDQGDAAATHSSRWVVLTIHDIFTFILPEVLQAPPLSASQLDAAIQAAADAGIPSSFTIRSDKTIGEGSANPNLADGKGLEHAADAYGPQAAQIYFWALTQP